MLSLVIVGTAEGQLIVADAPDWLHLPQPVNIERGMVKDMVSRFYNLQLFVYHSFTGRMFDLPDFGSYKMIRVGKSIG